MLTFFIHSHIYKKMKLKSKSPLLNTIISTVDDLLSKIPTLDQSGGALEDSLDFDQYVDSIKNLQLKDETGTNLHPFSYHNRCFPDLWFDLIKSKRPSETIDMFLML